jgi:hypothetical protein
MGGGMVGVNDKKVNQHGIAATCTSQEFQNDDGNLALSER